MWPAMTLQGSRFKPVHNGCRLTVASEAPPTVDDQSWSVTAGWRLPMRGICRGPPADPLLSTAQFPVLDGQLLWIDRKSWGQSPSAAGDPPNRPLSERQILRSTCALSRSGQ